MRIKQIADAILKTIYPRASLLQMEIKELKERLSTETQARLYCERIIHAYQIVIPANATIKFFSYFQDKKQRFMVIREGLDRIQFELFIPMLQMDEAEESRTLKPLAALDVSIKNHRLNLDRLKVNAQYENKDYGLTLLTNAFAELRTKGYKLISGNFLIPEGEEQKIRHFFNLHLIRILVDGNMLYISESEFCR